MNCSEFETQIVDLARGRLADQADRAMAHTAECLRCAGRLRDERRLTTGLVELRATYLELQSPPHIETRLLTAFRTERPVVPGRGRGIVPQWRRWAAAAVILAIAAVIAAVAMRYAASPGAQPVARQDNADRPQEVRPAPEPNHGTETPETPRQPQKTQPVLRRTAKTKLPPRDATMATNTANRDGGADGNNGTAPGEIATSFIPLTGGLGFAAEDSLQMVRIALPRSALVSFGLPMNIERADERIKADVLVGNDGVAHAIRFVR